MYCMRQLQQQLLHAPACRRPLCRLWVDDPCPSAWSSCLYAPELAVSLGCYTLALLALLAPVAPFTAHCPPQDRASGAADDIGDAARNVGRNISDATADAARDVRGTARCAQPRAWQWAGVVDGAGNVA